MQSESPLSLSKSVIGLLWELGGLPGIVRSARCGLLLCVSRSGAIVRIHGVIHKAAKRRTSCCIGACWRRNHSLHWSLWKENAVRRGENWRWIGGCWGETAAWLLDHWIAGVEENHLKLFIIARVKESHLKSLSFRRNLKIHWGTICVADCVGV